MRNPCSSFTFTNYLFTHGRLASYINKATSIPTRREWSAYLTWCADRMAHELPDVVRYGADVVSIEAISAPSSEESSSASTSTAAPTTYKVTYRNVSDNSHVTLFARNLAIGIGGKAQIPELFRPIYTSQSHTLPRIIHSSHYLPSLAALRRSEAFTGATATRAPRFAVIGSGQSSAEMTCNLHASFPTATVEMVFRAPAIRPSDDSSFVNAAAFDPEATDANWLAPRATRRGWRADFERTNYAVVRENVLNELFSIGYDQQIELAAPYDGAAGPSEGSVVFQPSTCVEAIEQASSSAGGAGGGITLTLVSKGTQAKRKVTYDAIFLGTGFARDLKSLDCVRPLQQHYPLITTNEEQNLAAHEDFDEPHADETDALAEFKRERNRGVTRDYRLVSNYALQQKERSLHAPKEDNSNAVSSSRSSSLSAESGASAAEHHNERSHSSSRTSTTLADSDSSGERQPSPSRVGASTQAQRGQQQLLPEGNVYVMGCNEPTHGLSDTLLSISAFRAGEIATSLRTRLHAQQQQRIESHPDVALAISNALAKQQAFEEEEEQKRGAAGKLSSSPSTIKRTPSTHSSTNGGSGTVSGKLSRKFKELFSSSNSEQMAA